MTDNAHDDATTTGTEAGATSPREPTKNGSAAQSSTRPTSPDAPKAEKIVFLGDSLTRDGSWAEWFPELDVVNLGVGGDTTDDVLARLDEVIAEQPTEIVLVVGTNDLGKRQTVEHLVRNVESICVALRKALPGSRMLVQSVLPRGREFAQRIQDANIHIRQFTSTVHAQFLDLWPALALEDGELNPSFTADRLHLTEEGYEAWLHELRPALDRLRELPPMTTPIQVVRPDQFSRPEPISRPSR